MAQPLSSLTSSSPVTPGVVRGMVVRCLLALVILTTVAIGGYVLDRRQTRLVRDQVELLAQDGRERMLANRVESLLREDALLALVMLTVTLSVIGFTGLAVFRPMIREVRLETENYVAANQALDQRAAELAATLEELEKERDERRLQLQEMAGMMHDLEEERGKLEREIQARQVVQEALEASEQRSFAIIESAPIAMMVTNGSGQIVMTNVRAEELFGYDREEILGQAVETVLVQRSGRSEANAASRRAGAPAEPAADAGLYGVAKDGRLFPVDVGTNPLEMEEGDYLLSAIVDITQRKRAEEEIRRINKELQKRNDEMQQFVYTISHDLKSPLVTCKGFMGLMKEDALAGRWDVVLDSVGRIERAIQRMGDLIEDLLQLSRIGVIRNEPEDVDVGQMVRAIADELADRLHHAGATLRVHEPLPHVIADRVRLAEVFENLLSNAIKYGCRGENGRIEIGGLTAAHEIRFYVRDHGPGIAKEFHRKIFGLFQRLESNQEGTGVGLAAVARIMETHGGRSWVESAPGQGATFWIAFPAICAVVARPFDLQTAPDAAETLTTRG